MLQNTKKKSAEFKKQKYQAEAPECVSFSRNLNPSCLGSVAWGQLPGVSCVGKSNVEIIRKCQGWWVALADVITPCDHEFRVVARRRVQVQV
jgi:hypothetical protein